MDKIYIYADESSQDDQPFMLLGGIALRGSALREFEQAVANLRVTTNMTKELKWSKVTQQKVNEYKAFIDLFFEFNESAKLSFHCMILDNAKIRHKQFSGSYELGFYKFFYQLLIHRFGKTYGPNNDLYVFLDQRQTGYKLDDLRTVLNNGMKKRYKIDRRPFRLVEFADSKKTAAVQIADIILGAIGYRKNKWHLQPGAKEAKVILSEYVLKRAKVRDQVPDTPYAQTRFTVWNFKLS
jgi:hypothetical protein